MWLSSRPSSHRAHSHFHSHLVSQRLLQLHLIRLVDLDLQLVRFQQVRCLLPYRHHLQTWPSWDEREQLPGLHQLQLPRPLQRLQDAQR